MTQNSVKNVTFVSKDMSNDKFCGNAPHWKCNGPQCMFWVQSPNTTQAGAGMGTCVEVLSKMAIVQMAEEKRNKSGE